MTKIHSLPDLDVENKKVLVRVDFNVPQDASGAITDDSRIVASLPTIKYLLEHKAKIILVSHLGRPKGKTSTLSLAPIAKRLSEVLGIEVKMAPDCIGDEVVRMCNALKAGECLLLENVRFYPAEEAPDSDPSFAKSLASLADLYVNDAFGTAHRAHSSTATIAKYFPNKKAAGFLLEKEIAFLGTALKNPKRPFYALIGGAKISTKLSVLSSLLEKVDVLMLGGAMAYTFFKAKGISIGNSLVENEMIDKAKELMQACQKKGIPLFLPIDIVAASKFENDAPSKICSVADGIPDGFEGMDIGPETRALWSQELQKAKTVLWNGPLGVCEFKNFSKGTFALAVTLATLHDCITIVGGGDTVAALQEAKLTDKMTHVSTGGGASLEYVEFGTLPGIEALH